MYGLTLSHICIYIYIYIYIGSDIHCTYGEVWVSQIIRDNKIWPVRNIFKVVRP